MRQPGSADRPHEWKGSGHDLRQINKLIVVCPRVTPTYDESVSPCQKPQPATVTGLRIPATAEAGLEIVEVSPGPGIKAKHGVPAIGGLDGVTNREQAGQGVSGGFIAQTQGQRQSGVHLPGILGKEEVVVRQVVLNGLPS